MALAGGLVGLVLGNVRLPVLLVASSNPAAGAGANIGVSGVAAAAAVIAHIRAGRINWPLFAWMAPPSMAGAVAGGYLSGVIPAQLLLVVIAAMLLYFGADLLRQPVRNTRPRGGGIRGSSGAARAEQPGPGGAVARGERAGDPRRTKGERQAIRSAVVSGAAIGLLGGLVGLILGSLRLPALIRYVGEAPAQAVGTNLAVGLCVGIAGLAGHVPAGVDWDLLLIGAVASVPGSVVGSQLTGRLSEAQLLRAIGVLLLVAGAATAAQALS